MWAATSMVPENATIVASWHTHPSVLEPMFSSADIMETNSISSGNLFVDRNGNSFKLDFQGAYLGVRGGNIYFYKKGSIGFNQFSLPDKRISENVIKVATFK